jgi:hypothetical protein
VNANWTETCGRALARSYFRSRLKSLVSDIEAK